MDTMHQHPYAGRHDVLGCLLRGLVLLVLFNVGVVVVMDVCFALLTGAFN